MMKEDFLIELKPDSRVVLSKEFTYPSFYKTAKIGFNYRKDITDESKTDSDIIRYVISLALSSPQDSRVITIMKEYGDKIYYYLRLPLSESDEVLEVGDNNNWCVAKVKGIFTSQPYISTEKNVTLSGMSLLVDFVNRVSNSLSI